MAIGLDGSDILTIERLTQPDGRLHPLQEYFLENGAIQCGFCTPGMILMGDVLMDEKTDPTENEIESIFEEIYVAAQDTHRS